MHTMEHYSLYKEVHHWGPNLKCTLQISHNQTTGLHMTILHAWKGETMKLSPSHFCALWPTLNLQICPRTPAFKKKFC